MSLAAPITPATITPLMFPSTDNRLMGVHYAPSPQTKRGIGMLMCNQVGPDYTSYYKTGRMLVNMLVSKGFDCFRFDYTGCGDSRGGFEIGSTYQWLADIASAEALFRELSSCRSLCLCGFGFGGLLAAAHAAVSDANLLVLWEPVIDGQAYCHRLRKIHKSWLRGSFVKSGMQDKQFQMMGFPATANLEQEMSQLTLTTLTSCRANQAYAIVSNASSDGSAIDEHFGRMKINFHICSQGEGLPLRAMRECIAWLEGTAGHE